MAENSTTEQGQQDLLTHVQSVWDGIRANSAIYRILLSDIRLVSATHGRVIAQLDIAPVHINSKGIFHGSVSATIVDWAGGMAIAATGLERTGVSTDIHVSYVSAAREGEVLEIEAWTTKVGRTLGYTQVEIRKVAKEDGGKGPVVCTGSHVSECILEEFWAFFFPLVVLLVLERVPIRSWQSCSRSAPEQRIILSLLFSLKETITDSSCLDKVPSIQMTFLSRWAKLSRVFPK